MRQTTLNFGIIEELRKHWIQNWKIIVIFFATFVAGVNILWQQTLANPEITIELFQTLLSVLVLAYLSAAVAVVYRLNLAKLENVIVKLQEESINVRNLAESCIQWAAAKPDQIEAILQAIKNVQTWNTANKQLEYIHDLEMRLEKMEKDYKKKELLKKKEVE